MSNALLRGLDVLKCFSQARRQLGASEIARLTEMPQPTAWRVCKALESQGYLVLEADGKYRPGLEVLSLGYAALNTMNIAALAAPSLQKIADRIKGTAGLSTPEGTSMLFLQRCEAPGAVLDYNMRGGVMLPMSVAASGWAYMALLPATQRTKQLQSIKRLGSAWSPDTERHAKEAVKQFAKAGFVTNDGVFYPGVYSIAVPFRSNRRGSYYVVSCSAMKSDFHREADHAEAATALIDLSLQLVDL